MSDLLKYRQNLERAAFAAQRLANLEAGQITRLRQAYYAGARQAPRPDGQETASIAEVMKDRIGRYKQFHRNAKTLLAMAEKLPLPTCRSLPPVFSDVSVSDWCAAP